MVAERLEGLVALGFFFAALGFLATSLEPTSTGNKLSSNACSALTSSGVGSSPWFRSNFATFVVILEYLNLRAGAQLCGQLRPMSLDGGCRECIQL
jgi:hypothetical protein